jgi:hypothetical protein
MSIVERNMKRIAALRALSIVFTLALAPISRTDAGTIGVTGKTYLVTVKSSFRTTFTDCFRFDVTSHRRAEHRWAGRVRYLPLRATVGG